jgi:hypothetical protein
MAMAIRPGAQAPPPTREFSLLLLHFFILIRARYIPPWRPAYLFFNLSNFL